MVISGKTGVPAGLSDEALACLAQGGCAAATSVLVARMSALVRAKAARLHAYGADADDLAQEGMLGLLSAIYTYREDAGAAFRTYASVCVGNRILSFLKTTSRRNRLPLAETHSLEELADGNANPEDLLIAEEELARLKQSLFSRLSGTEYLVITLYLAGCSYEEIAKQLGSTAKSVDNALQRVRRKLREADLTK